MKKTPLKRKTRLSPISKHRAKFRFVPPDILKKVKDRSGNQCERVFVKGGNSHNAVIKRCNLIAMNQPHHILGRAQGGTHTLENLIDLCIYCHSWVHNHAQQAIREGLMKPYRNYIHGSLED